MGNCCLPIRFRRTSSTVNPKNVTLLLVGLDNAGKTTIARRLAEEPIDTVVSTVGFSVILLRQKGCHVSIYDLGGGPQIRGIWPRYFADAHGVIFVTDAKDTSRIEECRQVLENLLRHEQISGKPVLLLANKQDIDGAMDEIDIVDKLNLEKLVNEQKCPTLVELCSAVNFTKKLDLGIENGYKWLLRSVIRDYPGLNNRVLKDLARQEEENRVHVMKKPKREVKRNEEAEDQRIVEVQSYVDPFKPIKRILEEKGHPNGVSTIGIRNNVPKSVTKIPGLIDEIPEKMRDKRSRIHRLLEEEMISAVECQTKDSANSLSSEFFISDKFQSDLELLKDVPNQSFKNFLVRPKSSGARLYGVKTERKKVQRRKPLRKLNKTGPSPFTDISNERNGLHQKKPSDEVNPDIATISSRKASVENINPFVISNREANPWNSKSTPTSRTNSVRQIPKKRRHSIVNGKVVDCFSGIELSPLKINNRVGNSAEFVLDVSKLRN